VCVAALVLPQPARPLEAGVVLARFGRFDYANFNISDLAAQKFGRAF
jgi:hypothetical protein